MGLDSIPVEARGLLSGIPQQGHSLGYLLAAVFTLAWASGRYRPRLVSDPLLDSPFTVGTVRVLFPESEQLIKAKEEDARRPYQEASW
jgi:SHS family lactate transporter-like MFS transporter